MSVEMGDRSGINFLRKIFPDPVSPARARAWLRLLIPHVTETVQSLHPHLIFTNEKTDFRRFVSCKNWWRWLQDIRTILIETQVIHFLRIADEWSESDTSEGYGSLAR